MNVTSSPPGTPHQGATSAKPASQRLANGVLQTRGVRYGLVALAVAAALGAVVAVVRTRPMAVQVASVERDVAVRVFGLGTVEARVLSKIGFEVGATLAELTVDHGDRVTKGEVLARLAVGEQEAKVDKARAAIAIAEGNAQRAEANLAKAKAVLTQKLGVNRRKQALVGRDIVSQQVAEEAVRDEAVATSDVAVAETEIASAKAQLTDARAQVRFEEAMLRHRTLVAPYDAVVIERHKELGTVVKAGDPIFTLVAIGGYWGLAYVDEARAGAIQEGQPVLARLRSLPRDAFEGKVLRIGLESDRVTEERRVYIRGDNPPPRIFLGEQVEFLISVATLPEALLVPEAAVHGYNGREGRVWTVEGGRLHHRLVQFRHRTEDARLEVVGGVPAGAQVVTSRDTSFRDGRAARVSAGTQR